MCTLDIFQKTLTVHYPGSLLNLVCVITSFFYKTHIYVGRPSTWGLSCRLFSKTCQLNFLYLPRYSDPCCISHAAVLHFIPQATYQVQCKLRRHSLLKFLPSLPFVFSDVQTPDSCFVFKHLQCDFSK